MISGLPLPYGSRHWYKLLYSNFDNGYYVVPISLYTTVLYFIFMYPLWTTLCKCHNVESEIKYWSELSICREMLTILYSFRWLLIKNMRKWDGCTSPQLPHSYYFTTRILVLKFMNKVVFFEEIQDSHFPRKREYFGTHLREFGEKGVNFDVQCFSFGLKIQCFTAKKGGSFWTETSVFYREKGVVLSWKVSVLLQKGVIFKLENKDGYNFFQWGSRALHIQIWCLLWIFIHISVIPICYKNVVIDSIKYCNS